MANLTKTRSGLLFYDDFSEKTLMWTLSPSDAICLSFGDEGLQMKHNNKYCSYTITEPSADEYSCIIKLDHKPYNYQDIAGVLILSTNKEYAECQTYLATGPSELTNAQQLQDDIKNYVDYIMQDNNYIKWSENDEDTSDVSSATEENENNLQVNGFIDTIYKYIKINKNKYKYIFYASEDGFNWIEVGNVKFADSNVIGFFIYGTNDKELISNSHCYFKEFAIYSSKYLEIQGLDKLYDAEIVDDNGNILLRTDSSQYQHMINRTNKKCLINTTTMPMPVINPMIRIYEKGCYSTTIQQFYLNDKIYGGDVYSLERDIRLYINNTEINQSEIYDLGTFFYGSYYVKLDVHNHEDYIVSDIKIKVIKYSEYYGGEEPVGVALYSEDYSEDELEYSKEVIIDEIRPSEGKSIFIKLMDIPVQDFYKTANSYRFKIMIE